MSTDSTIHTSIIIPTRNHAQMLTRLIDGLRQTAIVFDGALELIIVDNNSDEPALLDYLTELTRIESDAHFHAIKILRYPHKFNYSAINNLAVQSSRGRYLCFLNNDIEVIDVSWLTALSKAAERDNTGCVGAMLYYPDNTIQHAGVYLDANHIAGHLYKHESRDSTGHNDFLRTNQVVSAVTAACLLISRRIFLQVGGFDEKLSVAFNDVDLCLKVRQAGYTNVWTPDAALYHHESKSRGRSRQRSFKQKLNHKKEVFLMKRKWRTELRKSDQHHANSLSSKKEKQALS